MASNLRKIVSLILVLTLFVILASITFAYPTEPDHTPNINLYGFPKYSISQTYVDNYEFYDFRVYDLDTNTYSYFAVRGDDAFISKSNGALGIPFSEFASYSDTYDIFYSPCIITTEEFIDSLTLFYQSPFQNDSSFVVNSGYRNTPHNRKVGGAEFSKHMLGVAIDLGSTQATSAYYTNLAYSYGFAFAEPASGSTYSTHVDTRWFSTTSFPTVRLYNKGPHVFAMEDALKYRGYDSGYLYMSGYYSSNEYTYLVKDFQSDQSITVDGIVGPTTWGRLLP